MGLVKMNRMILRANVTQDGKGNNVTRISINVPLILVIMVAVSANLTHLMDMFVNAVMDTLEQIVMKILTIVLKTLANMGLVWTS